MNIPTSKMRRVLSPGVIYLAMLATIALISVPGSETVSARAQRSADTKTGAPVDVETMLARIFPLYHADSRLDHGRNGLDARTSLLKTRGSFQDVRNALLKMGLSNKLIAPLQEPGKITVTFKGWITEESIAKEGAAKVGTASMVLKIYDQAKGGNKLYEEIHELKLSADNISP